MTPQESRVLIGWIAVGIFGGLPLIGVVFNLIALRRRRTNSKCALSAALMLFSLVTLTAAGALSSFGQPILTGLIAMAGLGCVLASLILAIIGLTEMSGRRSFNRGRKRAIGVLAGCVLWVGLMVFGFYTGAKQGFRPKVLATSGQQVKNEQWNFRVDLPEGWMQTAPSAQITLARAAFLRERPTVSSLILSEDISKLGAVRLDAVMTNVHNNIKSNNEAEFLGEDDWSQNGLIGRRLESICHQGVNRLFYMHHVTQSNGVLYQLITWGAFSDREFVRADSRKLVTNFHILDSKRVMLADEERAPATFLSRKYGYSVNLTDTVWTRRWKNLAQNVPTADFGIQNSSNGACFCIVPVWIGDDPLDPDILTHSLAALVGVPFPGESVYGLKDFKLGQMQGRTLAFERSSQTGDVLFRIRVLRGRGYAYLLATWMDKASDPLTDFLDEAMDRVTFAEKVEPDPLLLDEHSRLAHHLTYNEISLALDRAGRPEAALPWMQRAYESDLTKPISLANYADLCLKASRPTDALAYLDKYIDRFPDDYPLAAKRATARYQTGDIDSALKAYGKLFDAGWRDDVEFTGYIRELGERSQHDEAQAALDRYTKGRETPSLRRLRAEALQTAGRDDEAIALLTAIRKDLPDDRETTLALAVAYSTAKRYPECIAECEGLITTHRESAEVFRRKGFAEFMLKRFREAKTSFEAAHDRDPANTDTKRLLDHVSGLLGEGGNSTVKRAIAPVSIAAEIKSKPVDPSDPYLKGYSAWYRQVVKAISYKKGDELKTTERFSIEIRDQQGVEKFSTLEFGFDPLSEEVFVNSLTIKDATGKLVSEGRVEDSYVVDDGVGETASQAKILHVPVPALQPGYTLDYTVTRRETSEAKSFTFSSVPFLKGLPVLHHILEVHAAADSFKWEASPGLPAPTRSGDTLTWSVERTPVYRYEPLQAPLESFVPMVWLSDPSATWPGEAKDYLTQIKDRLPVAPDIQATAERLTKGLDTREEKIAALSRFVQRELTYKAIEFGRRARIPCPAAQTLRNKYGDCKDHALLLCQLLESSGIPAQLALVRSSGSVRSGLPSLDQFDHMVTYLPREKSGTYIDCTSKSGDLRASPPYGLATRQALVLDPAKPHLETLPPYAPGSSDIKAIRKVSFSSDTDLQVEEDLVFKGMPAAGLRGSLLAVQPAQRTHFLLQMLAYYAPSLELREATFEHLDDPQEPLGMHLRYVLRRHFQDVGGQLIGHLPALWEKLYFSNSPVEERVTPFKIWIPTRFESHTTFVPPAGWQPPDHLAQPQKLDGEFCSVTAASRWEAKVLHLESTLVQQLGQFAPAKYNHYLDASREALAIVEQNLALQREAK